MKRSVLLLPLLAVVMVGATACTSKTPGEANATQPPVATSAGAATPSQSGTATSLKDTDPCSLISGDALSQLGLSGVTPKNETIGYARVCKWQVSGSHIVSVGIYNELGLKDLVATDIKPVPRVGRHEAVRGFGGAGDSCVITIGVTEKSRVDVSSTNTDGDKNKACRDAMAAAPLVEKNLP